MQNQPFTLIGNTLNATNSTGQLIAVILLEYPFSCFQACRNETRTDFNSTSLNITLVRNLTYNDESGFYSIQSIALSGKFI